MRLQATLASILLVAATAGCDIISPQKEFRLATPANDYFYSYVSSHLKPFLEGQGYRIRIIETANSVEANRLVAGGEADIAYINNHSIPVAEEVGPDAANLRTIAPLATRLFFAFSRTKQPDTVTIRELLNDKKIGIEILGGELDMNLRQFLAMAEIKYREIVTVNEDPDVVVFWGTLYGSRASRYMSEGWHPFSFKSNWIEFMTLNESALRPYSLPSIPGNPNSIRINTVATEAILVGRHGLGENAVYELAHTLFKNKMELIRQDIMYLALQEDFDQQALLYPLHEGTVSYLRRAQPTFLERYADTIALLVSFIAIAFGVIQTIRNRIAKRKKDRIDNYFLDFLEIRSDRGLSQEDKVSKLDGLFQRAVEQMTSEKLEKSDFHILSRLIQQELTIVNLSKKTP